MKLLTTSLTYLTLAATLVSCRPAKTEKYGYDYTIAAYSCENRIGIFEWGINTTDYYAIRLAYPPGVGSLMHCIVNRIGYNTKSFNESMSLLLEAAEYGELNVTEDYFRDQYNNATAYLLDASNVNKTIPSYSPINITKEMTEPNAEYLKDLYFNFDFGSYMGIILICFWFAVLIIIGLGNFIKRLGYHRRFHGKWINWYRSKFTIPALFNGKHAQDHYILKFYATLIPTRAETIAVILFSALNGLLLGVNLDAHHPYDLYHITYRMTLDIFMADRTGLLSFGLIPLLILFAGRNNILTSLTGLPYTSFITFHKWISRWMWIHALIHSACWVAYAIMQGYMEYYLEEVYWHWGIAATCLGFLILVLAIRTFRNMSYEVFLVLHILLAIGFIICCYYHCYELGWLEWIYAASAVWVFDRVVRVVRMCLFGFPEAEIIYVGEDTFKITVPNTSRWFNPFPGAFAYIYFITPTLFLQSHPFTIIESIEDTNKIIVYVKTKAGITKRIRSRIEKDAVDGVLKMKVCLEGPYGHKAPLHKYDTSLIIAGGNGIPGPLSYALDLGQKNAGSVKQHIKFVWVIRTTEYLGWFAKEVGLLSQLGVNAHIYITSGLPEKTEKGSIKFSSDVDETKAESQSNTDTASSNSDAINELFESSTITFHAGRPNIDELIKHELVDSNNGSVGVLTCGAPIMVDHIRTSVADHLQECAHRVDLFEELQVW